MISQDLTGKGYGKIFTRKPNPKQHQGIVVALSHTGNGVKNGKHHRFLHASFQTFGEKLIAGDQLGSIFLFDIPNNRFSQIQNTGKACTCIASGLRRHSEYLVALADTSLKCYSTGSKDLVSWMRGHDSAVHSISVDDSGRFAITTSADNAQLWDLDTFERKRKLNVKTDIPIQEVFFLASTNLILTCFKDDTIFAWDSDTLEWKYQLQNNRQTESIKYKTFAATRNGKVLVAGGKSNLLHVYLLDTNKIVRIIQMPEQFKTVKQVLFLPDKFDQGANKILGVLGEHGIVAFIDIDTCRVVFELVPANKNDKITEFCPSHSGEHLTAVTQAGQLIIYNTFALCEEISKAPGPLVKVVSDVWKRKTFSDKNNVSSSTNTLRRPKSQSVSTGRIKSRSKIDTENINPEDTLPSGLSRTRLRVILQGYGEYPEQHRMFIWRSILQLPENQLAFDSLVKKGTHLAYASLQDKYPVKNARLQRVLQKICSCFGHWSCIFGEVDYLPFLAFPFVKLFQNNHLICFEMIATFIVNWCQHWFEFFPNPPIGTLSAIENVLSHCDKDLLQHFVKHNITTQIYAWPLLQTLFTEVMTRDEWLRLFDHIFSNRTSFFLYCIVAYCTCCRAALIKTKSADDIKYFFHHRNAIDLSAVIKEAYHLMETTPSDIKLSKNLAEFEPLIAGPTYPVYNQYPKFIVDYQAQERERIRKDELQYLRERRVAIEVAEEVSKRKVEEEAWFQRQEMLQDAEENRRKILVDEEQKLVDQRVRLAAMKRELRVRELQLLDNARMKFVQQQQMKKETQIKRLEDEIERKAYLREQETAAAVEDVEVKALELEAHKATLQQQMMQLEEELGSMEEASAEAFRKKQDQEDLQLKMMLQGGQEQELNQNREWQRKVGEVELQKTSVDHQRNMATQRLVDNQRKQQNFTKLIEKNNQQNDGQKFINTDLIRLLEFKEIELSAARKKLADQHRRLAVAELAQVKLMEKEGEKLKQRKNSSLDEFLQRTVSDGRMTTVSNDQLLSEISSTTDDSIQLTLDRGRGSCDGRESQLMKEVRELRQRLVSHHVKRMPLPPYNPPQ